MANHRFSTLARAILALCGLATATVTASSCSSKVVQGVEEPTCASGVPCDEGCCTSGQECVRNSCLPVCPTQIRCGALLELCCAEGETCSGGLTCEPAEIHHADNDSCSSPGALEFTAGVAREHGTTAGAQSDTLLMCATNLAGNDVVYSFGLAKEQKVTVSVRPDEGSALRPVLALRNSCASNTNLACVAPPAAGGATTLDAGTLPTGRYFIWIAGNAQGDAGAGSFALTVTLTDPEEPPANDTCANAAPVDLATTQGHALVHGTLAAATADSTSNTPPARCPPIEPTPGPDVVYKIEVPETQAFSARVAFDNPTSHSVAGLYLRKSCDANAQEVGCPENVQHFAALQIAALPQGTYYLFVDTASAVGEPFTLSVDLGTAPANDSCATGAQTITLDTAGKATINGDTTFANNDSTGDGQCGLHVNDVVYKLHLDHDRSATFTVTPTGLNFAPIVYVRSACAGTESLACGFSMTPVPVTVQLDRLAAGDWFIWVGGYYAPHWGSFTLAVTTVDVEVPPNDLCENAIALHVDPATKKAHVTGSTTLAWDDYQGTTCGMRDPVMDGPDLVYKLTLTEEASLTLTLARDPTVASALTPALYVRANDCASTSPADEKVCVRADWVNAPDSVTAQIPTAAAGVYYIIVDGETGTAGPFALDVTVRTAIANDTCAHPQDIPIDATTGIGSVRGDTSLGSDDDYGACQSRFSGPDLVYQFTLAQDRAVTVDLAPDATTYKPVLYVRQTCDLRASQALNGCAATTVGGTTAHLSFRALAQGTYFVWVDGNTTAAVGTSGAFTLTITTIAPPAAAPVGDTCATAIPLTLAATNDPAITRATATGDTTDARDNALGVGLCEGSAAGDLVYSVTLGEAHQLKAVVTPDAASAATFQPVVYIRGNACASGADADQLAGGVASAAGGTATAVANSLPQGTYWIWVDSLSTTGAFSLEVFAMAPAAGPANDNCSAPQVVTFTPGTTTATVTGTTVGAQNDTSAAPPSSNGALGGDVVFSFTATNTTPRSLTASVVGAAGAPASFLPVVSVREHCGGLADELSSMQAASSTQPATTWPIHGITPGAYYVWIDTGRASLNDPPTPGPFVLTLTLEVPNDRCEGAEDISLTFAATGDTTDAVDQYGTNGGFSAPCAAALGGITAKTPGPEVAYIFFAMRNFTVTVTPEAGYDTVVWVTKAFSAAQGGLPGNCVAAANAAGAGGAETVSATTPGGEQFFILVDSAQASAAGKFSLRIQ